MPSAAKFVCSTDGSLYKGDSILKYNLASSPVVYIILTQPRTSPNPNAEPTSNRCVGDTHLDTFCGQI
jgi:hypothetical protein